MLIKIDLTTAFTRAASRLACGPARIATLSADGDGRVPPDRHWGALAWGRAVWRAIRGHEDPDAASLRLLAWGVVSGITFPRADDHPYVDTLQFYIPVCT